MKLILHSIAILFILAPLATVFAQHNRSEIMAIFKKEIEINEIFKSSADNQNHNVISGKSYDTLRKESETYHENIFTPALDTAKNIICDKKDRILLRMFLKVLISITNSADEGPDWILGDIFICQSNLVISEYIKLRESEKPIILKALNFGFDNVTYNKEKDIKNYKSLKSKLLNLNKQ